MTWFKLDDGFHSHPKVTALFEGPCPGDAIALFVLAGSWASRELTDGAVPVGFVRRSGLHEKAASELERVGLWNVREDGSHLIHDYLQYNPDRETVLRDRAAGALRKAAHRNRLGRGKPNASGEALSMPRSRLEQASPSPDPVPDPVFSSERIAYPSSAAASSSRAAFGGGRVLREVLPGDAEVAARGAAWLARVTGREPFNHAGKWSAALAALAGKPEAERAAAAAILAAESARPGGDAFLNPQHVADYWHLYSQGKAPGNAAAKSGARRYAGPSRVPTAEEHARDAKEVAPWDR